MSLVSGVKSAALSGFNRNRLENAAFAIGGSFITSYVAGKAYDVAGHVLPKDGVIGKVAKVGVTLLTAGAVGYAAKKVVPSRANKVLLGGLISGVVEGLNQLFPSLKSLGMKGYDIADEWGQSWNLGDYADPRQLRIPINTRQPFNRMNGMRDYADFRQIQQPVTARQPLGAYANPRQMQHLINADFQPMAGMRDYADVRQIQQPVTARQPLGSYADQMVGEEISMM